MKLWTSLHSRAYRYIRRVYNYNTLKASIPSNIASGGGDVVNEEKCNTQLLLHFAPDVAALDVAPHPFMDTLYNLD